MRIRSAHAYDIDPIARVHVEAFPGFFLTRMGVGFLRELYNGFLNTPSGVLLVAEDDVGKIIGFVAGTVSPDRFFADLRRKRGWKFLFFAIPCVLKNPVLVLRKLYSAIFYSGDKPRHNFKEGALLSSIGVSRRSAGNSVGKKLLTNYEELVFMQGVSFVYLFTDEFDNEQVNIFYTRNGYCVESKFIQGGKRPMLCYLKRAPSCAQIA